MGKVTSLDFREENFPGFGPASPPSVSIELNALQTEFSRTIPVSVGPLGFDLNAQFNSGFQSSLSATAGLVDISYPIQVAAAFPEAVSTGQTFSIDTSAFSVVNPLLHFAGPHIGAEAKIVLEGSAGLNNISVGGIPLSNVGITSNLGFSFDATQSFSLNPSNLSFEQDFGGFGSIRLEVPAQILTSFLIVPMERGPTVRILQPPKQQPIRPTMTRSH